MTRRRKKVKVRSKKKKKGFQRPLTTNAQVVFSLIKKNENITNSY
jgi:transcription elongation factor Elf1